MKYIYTVLLLVLLSISLPMSIHAADTRPLSDPTKYNIRIDGASQNDSLGLYILEMADFNNNGRNDVLVGSSYTSYNGNFSGSMYIIFDAILDDYSGTGNTIDLADTTKYNLRIDGPMANAYLAFDSSIDVGDVDGDGLVDIMVATPYANYNSRSSSGSIFVIPNTAINQFTGTGNTTNLSDPDMYSLRIDGPSAGHSLGDGLALIGDINGNGKNDVSFNSLTSDYNSRTDSGSVYIIFDAILDDYSGTGNTIDLADTSNFNVRFDGAEGSDYLGMGGGSIADLDNDGSPDYTINSSFANPYGRADAGSLYVIYGSLLDDYSNTGNTVDLADPSTYNLRFDGEIAGDSLGILSTHIVDMNNNGKQDLTMGAYQTDFNDRATSGSLYLFYDDLIDDFTGTGNNIDLADHNNFTARIDAPARFERMSLWTTLSDLNGDGRLELIANAFRARPVMTNGGAVYIFENSQISNHSGRGLLVDMADTSHYSIRYDTDGSIYLSSGGISAGDINNDGLGDVMIPSRYASNNDRSSSGSIYLIYSPLPPVASSNSGDSSAASHDNGPEFLANTAGIVTKHDITSMVSEKTLPWDAYLDINKTLQSGSKRISNSYWQISPVYQIWHKSTFNDARILLPNKPFTLIFPYDQNSYGHIFNGNEVEVLFSSDEGKTWELIPNAVRFPWQNKIAVVTPTGGHFVIVAK